MALVVTKPEMDDFAALFLSSGILSFKYNYKGPEVVIDPSKKGQALSALKMLTKRLSLIDNIDGKQQFMDMLSAKIEDKAKSPQKQTHTLYLQ